MQTPIPSPTLNTMAQTKHQVDRPMSTATPVDTDLHLPDLRIEGFRGIKELTITRLGRVTLLAGKNGAGKTTVLEAVRAYAEPGRYGAIADTLWDREETVQTFNEESGRELPSPNWEALFFGRAFTSDSLISVGPISGDRLQIQTKVVSTQKDAQTSDPQILGDVLTIAVEFRGSTLQFPTVLTESHQRMLEFDTFDTAFRKSAKQCESLGPEIPSSRQLAGFWDKVALTEEESKAVDSLNLINSDKVERVAMIGDDSGTRRGAGRRPVAKLRDEPRPVPLKSLGDGAVRLFGIALALANSKDGFLLIDEAENGIHYSIQRDFWTMILKAAHQNNVQVLATTHSWDCVAGFALAATEVEEVDGALVRLDRYDDRIKAVEYTEDDLRVAAKHGIEVR